MSEAKLAGLNANILTNRSALNSLWSHKNTNGELVSKVCQKHWDAWTISVRSEYLKRAQAAVIAGVQTSIPRKQWSQWEVTLKFCLDDIFVKARGTAEHQFTSSDNSLGSLLGIILEGEENQSDPEEFESKIEEMLVEMRTNKVPGFDASDSTHGPTLRAIRSIYAIQWANYLIAKLSAQ